MSEVVEIKTGTEVSTVVEELAKTMGEETLCLSVPQSVAEGEWVRFSIQLVDGTHVIEGIGRCAGAIPRGNPTDHYDLHLAELSFDERNEIMYERMLIAKDAAKQGDDTGTIKLEEVAMETLAGKDEATESSPPSRSVPPPPPSKGAAPAKPVVATPRPSSMPGKAGATAGTSSAAAGASSKGALTKSLPTRQSSPPGKRTSTPPGKRTSTPPGKRTSTPPSRRASTPPAKRETADATKVDLEAPEKARASARPSRRPVAIADGPFTLEVPSALVAHARRLEDRLPRKLFDRDRSPGQPEAAVLMTALRVGLGALEGAADDD